MRRIAKAIFVLATLPAILAAPGYAADLKIGDDAPDFRNIIGVDNNRHSMSDYGHAKLVVIVFTCNHCPVAQAYEKRLISLQRKYDAKGVQFSAVNVNNLPEDQLSAMKIRSEEKLFNFPYLYDATQKMGHDYGALVTPHVFLLDQHRKIAYIGAVDNNMQANKVTKPYLRNALDAQLAGKKPPQQTTKAFGCSIRYE